MKNDCCQDKSRDLENIQKKTLLLFMDCSFYKSNNVRYRVYKWV